MNRFQLFALGFSRFPLSIRIMAYAAALPVCMVAGCGGGRLIAGPEATMTGETAVAVLATSTANDKLTEFSIQFTGISLTSQSGKTVNLLTAPVTTEFIHLNGAAEPLVFGSAPQDVYTSASVTLGSAWFTCTNFDSSTGLESATFEDLQVPASAITVSLPGPIQVTGTTLGVSFDLLASQSASYSACTSGGNATFSITPKFTVSPVAIAADPTNSTNGEVTGMHGLISSVDTSGSNFSVQGADGSSLFGPSWQFSTDSGTAFQGVSGLKKLVKGMPVDIDAVIQPGGSLLAKRVGVYDTDTTDLNIFTGPVNMLGFSPPVFSIIGQEQEGFLDDSSYYVGAFPVSAESAKFQTSGALTNLEHLPFTVSFNAGNVVSGQSYSVTSHVSGLSGATLPVATVTLMPQTINGVVSSISNDGAFTTYTVTLAPYDAFPNLAKQPSEANVLSNPDTIVVYADGDAQQLNSTPLGLGGLFRFNGLIFNDKGTLRMDCARINDGVAE
ncbi:MAG: DUF5666 domain-containing protein [Terracidiphilus sp.]